MVVEDSGYLSVCKTESDENQIIYSHYPYTESKNKYIPTPHTHSHTVTQAPIQIKENVAKGDVKESYSFISQDKQHKSQHLINCPKETMYYPTEAG